MKKAVILAIGTELTQGQITNRNASWLSAKLTELQIQVVSHIAVADDREMILQALKEIESKTDFLMVTGGLGPTSDDFTREVLAQWANRELLFDEPSWKWIEDRLSGFGIKVSESNRQQCYFPMGSRLYSNPKGTARGFGFDAHDIRVFVFPGPPHELETVWENGACEDIKKFNGKVEGIRLFKWGVVGQSEAALAEEVEKLLKGSGLQIGYRAHPPYVEVKIWIPEDQFAEKQKWISAADELLKPNTIVRDNADLAEIFLKKVSEREKIIVMDDATTGLLTMRLLEALRKPPFKDLFDKIEITTQPHYLSEPKKNVFSTWGLEKTGAWSWSADGKVEKAVSPYAKNGREDRNRRYITEMTLYHWCNNA